MTFVAPEAVNDLMFEVGKRDVTPAIHSLSGEIDTARRVIGQAITSTVGLGTRRWLRLSSCVLGHRGSGANGFGFRYPTDELDWDEEPFEGVQVYALSDEVYVEIDTWDALMLRFFKKAIESAQVHHDEALDSDWWPEFIDNVEAIERRCVEIAAATTVEPGVAVGEGERDCYELGNLGTVSDDEAPRQGFGRPQNSVGFARSQARGRHD